MIVHTCLYVSVVSYVADIPKYFALEKQAHKALQTFPICITDSYCGEILEKMMR